MNMKTHKAPENIRSKTGKFAKGVSGNPTGRPKGTPNKTTSEIRKLFAEFISANIDNLQSIFDKLDPKEQIMVIERFAKIILPPPIDELETLSEEQLEQIITKLKNEQNEISE